MVPWGGCDLFLKMNIPRDLNKPKRMKACPLGSDELAAHCVGPVHPELGCLVGGFPTKG